MSLLTKFILVVALIVIFQPSFQGVTLGCTLTSTGCVCCDASISVNTSLAYIIRKDSTPMEGEETAWDDPWDQIIERVSYTITEADGTIIKHPTFMTDNKMFLTSLLN